MPMQTLALFFLATVATGGIAWVFLYPYLSGERQIEKRKEIVAKPEGRMVRVNATKGSKARREQVEDSLKELEQRQKKAKNPPISVRITQAGLDWSKRKFLVVSGFLALAVALAPVLLGGNILVTLGVGFAAGFGLPR
jgi:tight adherence protein B